MKIRGTYWPSKERTGEGLAFTTTWDALAAKLAEPPAPPNGSKNGLALWTMGTFRDKTREAAEAEQAAQREHKPDAKLPPYGTHYRAEASHVESSALMLDYDANADLDEDLLHGTWGAVNYLAHTSWSHGPDMPKWRVLLPLSRPVSSPEYKRLMDWAAARIPGLDSRPAAQGYFVPVQRDGYLWAVNPGGDPLDVDAVLAEVAAAEPAPQPRQETQADIADKRARRYGLAALDSQAAELSRMVKGSGAPGGRHGKLFSAAASMAQLSRACGVSESVAWSVLEGASQACGLAADEGDKLRRTFDDGWLKGIVDPRELPESTYKPSTRPPEDEAPHPAGEESSEAPEPVEAPSGVVSRADRHADFISRFGDQREMIPIPLDELSEPMGGGLTYGQHVVIAGRSGDGKTALSLYMMLYAALRAGVPSLFVSLEQPAYELRKRLIAQLAAFVDDPDGSVNMKQMVNEQANGSSVLGLSEQLAELPVWVEDNVREASKILDLIGVYVRDRGVRYVFLDHVQQVKNSELRGNQAERLTIADFSKRWYEMVKQTDIVGCLLSQDNRGQETGEKKRRPRPSDLKGSGALEEHADKILFAYTPTPESEWGELIVGKDRQGAAAGASAQYTRDPHRLTFRPYEWRDRDGGF
jgi:archaellum biogenesis ATPase FlaH